MGRFAAPRTLGLTLVALLVLPPASAAHPGVGLLVGPDGTVYFVLSGPYPVMMLRPGSEPEFVTVDTQPRFAHHLAWLADGRILTATDQGELFVMVVGGRAELYLAEDAVDRLRESDAIPRTMPTSLRTSLGVPVGFGGDPFTVDREGRVYAVHRWNVAFSGMMSRVLRISPDGTLESFAGGRRRARDGDGDAAGLRNLHYGAMVWGADGGLYVSERERVRRIGPDGEVTTLQPEFDIAAGLAAGPDGSILVVEARPNRVVRVDPSGARTEVVTAGRFSRFRSLVGVALGPDGSLFLKDHPGDATRIWRVTDGGTPEVLAVVDHRQVEAEIGYVRPPPMPAQLDARRRSRLILGFGIPAVLLGWLVLRRFVLRRRD